MFPRNLFRATELGFFCEILRNCCERPNENFGEFHKVIQALLATKKIISREKKITEL